MADESDEPWEDDFSIFGKPKLPVPPNPGADLDDDDDFSTFGVPASSPVNLQSGDDEFRFAGPPAASVTAAFAEDDDDEFSEFGHPACPPTSTTAAMDDDDEFAEFAIPVRPSASITAVMDEAEASRGAKAEADSVPDDKVEPLVAGVHQRVPAPEPDHEEEDEEEEEETQSTDLGAAGDALKAEDDFGTFGVDTEGSLSGGPDSTEVDGGDATEAAEEASALGTASAAGGAVAPQVTHSITGESEDEEEEEQKASMPRDDFSAFDAAVGLAPDAAFALGEEAEDSDFPDDLGGPERGASSDAQASSGLAEPAVEGDDFGDFSTSQAKQDETEADDDFGDFAAQPAEAVEPPHQPGMDLNSSGPQQTAGDDEFNDFGAATVGDDGFGEFDQAGGDDAFGDFGDSSGGGGDDFGDFGSSSVPAESADSFTTAPGSKPADAPAVAEASDLLPAAAFEGSAQDLQAAAARLLSQVLPPPPTTSTPNRFVPPLPEALSQAIARGSSDAFPWDTSLWAAGASSGLSWQGSQIEIAFLKSLGLAARASRASGTGPPSVAHNASTASLSSVCSHSADLAEESLPRFDTGVSLADESTSSQVSRDHRSHRAETASSREEPGHGADASWGADDFGGFESPAAQSSRGVDNVQAMESSDPFATPAPDALHPGADDDFSTFGDFEATAASSSQTFAQTSAVTPLGSMAVPAPPPATSESADDFMSAFGGSDAVAAPTLTPATSTAAATSSMLDLDFFGSAPVSAPTPAALASQGDDMFFMGGGVTEVKDSDDALTTWLAQLPDFSYMLSESLVPIEGAR